MHRIVQTQKYENFLINQSINQFI